MLAQLNLWLPLFGVTLALAALYFCLATHKKLRHLQTKHLADVERLEKQLSMVNGVSLGMGQRMLLLEQKLASTGPARRQEPVLGEAANYSQALQLFERGLDAAAVASSCGISRSEAQLMQLIRKQANSTRILAD